MAEEQSGRGRGSPRARLSPTESGYLLSCLCTKGVDWRTRPAGSLPARLSLAPPSGPPTPTPVHPQTFHSAWLEEASGLCLDLDNSCLGWARSWEEKVLEGCIRAGREFYWPPSLHPDLRFPLAPPPETLGEGGVIISPRPILEGGNGHLSLAL